MSQSENCVNYKEIEDKVKLKMVLSRYKGTTSSEWSEEAVFWKRAPQQTKSYSLIVILFLLFQ